MCAQSSASVCKGPPPCHPDILVNLGTACLCSMRAFLRGARVTQMSNIHLFFAGVPSDGPTPTAFTSLFLSSPGGNVTPGVKASQFAPKNVCP